MTSARQLLIADRGTLDMLARTPCLIAVLLILSLLCRPAESGCTIGAAGGTVTADGRPLLWKSRMLYTTAPNEVAYFAATPYDYIAVRCNGAYHPQMGVNSAGLCTGNSLVGPDDSGDGPFTAEVLRSCATVADVRDYIHQRRDAGTLNVSGCFPFVDAAGNAVVFEISFSNWVIEYDSLNPNRAAQGLYGWVVRANEFHHNPDGTDDIDIGGRYHSGAFNIAGLIACNSLSARTIIQGNDGSYGYEFMRYGPGRPLATLADPRVRSSMVVRGVLPSEDPALTTMWIMLGHANYGIAVPTWARVSAVPNLLRHGAMADRANALRTAGNELETQTSVFPVEDFLFHETEELLAHWRSVGVPSVDEMTRVETRMTADAHSLLLSLDLMRYDNRAPTVAIRIPEMSAYSVQFQAGASDPDGSIQRRVWDFGDGNASLDEAPLHTYDAPGWYLVSCTVTDNDCAALTDWQYLRVPKGNCDGDQDVDLDDYGTLLDCAAGPGTPPAAQGCEVFDTEDDGDIDLADFAGFQTLFTGSRR